MSRVFSKFGFIHRLLWSRDGLYRGALLLGPAPLVGCAIGAAIWAGYQAIPRTTEPPPSWAVVRSPTMPTGAGDQPKTAQPARPLPPANPDGTLAGYQAGWIVTAHSVQITATMDANIDRSTLNGFNVFSLVGPDIDMARIAAAGPKNTSYIGIGSGFLVVREPGVYAMTASYERPAGPPASCLIRLGFGGGLVVANLELNLVNSSSRSFNVDRFDLQPGLYPILWAFGCWHEHEMSGLGRMHVLIAHPGEPTPLPARPGDIVQ
jgi:hypothetical protein